MSLCRLTSVTCGPDATVVHVYCNDYPHCTPSIGRAKSLFVWWTKLKRMTTDATIFDRAPTHFFEFYLERKLTEKGEVLSWSEFIERWVKTPERTTMDVPFLCVVKEKDLQRALALDLQTISDSTAP